MSKILLTIYIAGVIYNLCYLIYVLNNKEFMKIADKNNFFTNQMKKELFLSCFLSWGIFLKSNK